MANQGLNKIGSIETKVKVSTIVEALKRHREAHQVEYAEARQGYEEAFKKKAAQAVKLIKKADPKDTFDGLGRNFGLVVPIDNTKMYDHFISTFEAVSSEELTLDITELNTIINNSWDWVATSTASFSSYKNA